MGTYRLGIVEEIEVDLDGKVRTCVVGYWLSRSDLPYDQLRYYYKGLKRKTLCVPVKRLCIILPVEESGIPEFLQKKTDVDTVIEAKVQAVKFNFRGKGFDLNRTIMDMHKALRSFLLTSE